jgi:transposase
MARSAGALRSLYDGLQPLQPLGSQGGLAAAVRDAGGTLAAVAATDRQFDRSGPPACSGWKKGGPDHAIGRSRGGLSTKIHAVVDQDGLPVRLLITPGQASDKTSVPDLLAGLPSATVVVADRGYDSRAIIDLVKAKGGEAHIPTQSRVRIQRSVDRELYRRRNLIERYFCNLKQFRRIATRFEKLARNFLAAVALASARIWLRAIESTP